MNQELREFLIELENVVAVDGLPPARPSKWSTIASKLRELLRRDWDRQVCNSWAMSGASRCVELFPGGEGWRVVIKRCVNPINAHDEEMLDAAERPDGAYAAAAKFLLPQLPESERQRIGERP